MTNTKQNTIELDSKIAIMANQRADEVEEAISGGRRLRSSRWENRTSVRDAHRGLGFLDQLATGKLNIPRYTKLNQEINSFQSMLGTNLSKKIRSLF